MLSPGVGCSTCTRFPTTFSLYNFRINNSTGAHRQRRQLLIMSCCFGFAGSSERRPVVSSSPARAGGGSAGSSDRRPVASSFPARAGRGNAASSIVQFPLSASSSLKIQKGDITEWSVDGVSDAIVNPANERMLGGGGADEAIHGAAGRELKEACYRVPEVRPGVRCPTGEARITPGFMLPVAYVIHTVGPVYGADSNAEASLKSAYWNSLCVAKENNIQYIAFTAISCGIFRYPLDEAAKVAISTVKEFGGDIKEVHFVLFSDEIYRVWLEKATQLVGK